MSSVRIDLLSWRRFPAYPILFGLFAVLSVLSANIGEIPISASFRSLVVAAVFGALLLGGARALTREWNSAGLLAFAGMLVFFSYGHAYAYLKGVQILGVHLGRHRYMVPASMVFLALMTAFSLRERSRLAGWTVALNLIMGIAVMLPLLSLGYETMRHGLSRPAAAVGVGSQPTLGEAANGQEPDIYYIITDTYARFDILKEQYGYDNSRFESWLTREGFYVAYQSQANFLFTHLSMTSSLNMDYMQTLFPNYSSGDQLPIKNNLVRSELESLGYKTVAFATGWDATEWFNADYVFTPGMGAFAEMEETRTVNRFEGILMQTTALQIFVDWASLNSTPIAAYVRQRLADPFTVQRGIVLAEFDHLKDVPKIPGPKFVFVHILPPHGPHLFGPNGEEVKHNSAFTLLSGLQDSDQLSDEEYVGELAYVTYRLEDDIDTILRTSQRPVVIILQSDHGPAHNLDWNNPSVDGVKSRISILNAYYVPDSCRKRLYPSITPVNSFRLLFSCQFGAQIDLLPDRTYYGYDTYVPADELLRSLEGK